jgi:hypothetical protein
MLPGMRKVRGRTVTALAVVAIVSAGAFLARGGLPPQRLDASQPTASAIDAQGDARQALVIADGHRVAAARGDHLILLLDFNPSRGELEAAGSAASEAIIATATKYAREYFASPEYAGIVALDAYVVFVDSMDEYNRANYAGMKRFGTLTFARRDGDIVITDNKLAFSP